MSITTLRWMSTQVIVLNGGSSSGKSGIARCLQSLLMPRAWLTLGVDDLVDALPAALRQSEAGLVLGLDGEVSAGPEFAALDDAWAAGVGAMARAGARVVVDEVFLGGAASQERWRKALDGLGVLWVGVRCDPRVATGRETARGDRVPGMAALQAEMVHRGVSYDMEVDTTRTESLDCARAVAARLAVQDA
jgi:chloramphenicol 3-O phosphotransferase